jgi:SAM-dependent methyltransferase
MVIHLSATDPAAPVDLAAWCHLTGHAYLGLVPEPLGGPAYALRVSVTHRQTEPYSPWRLTSSQPSAPASTGGLMASTYRQRPLFARFYARISNVMERAGAGEYRDRLLAGLSGEVIEAGAGNGLNFAHYPAQVIRVLAIEPEPRLRALAQQNAGTAPVPVEVIEGVAERIPAADGSFDAAVACLMLCSVPDQAAVLAELHRVLRPGGQLRFFEHVRAGTAGMHRVQHLLDATVWPALFGGCHTGRDTAAAITSAGFTIDRLEQFAFPESRLPSPTSTHILGTATRAGNP